MSNQLIIPRALDANGDSASGAKAYVYQTGTSTPVTVYQNTGLSVAHANPIVANSAGYFAQAFYGGSTALRVVITDSADATLVTYDPVPIVSLSSAAASSISFTPTTPIPATDVQSAIVSVQSTLDTRVKPLENGARVAVSGGSSSAYTLTPTNAVSAYAAGQEYEFVANHANTGATTLNVSSLGGIAVQKYNASAAKVALASGDIATGQIVRVKHDGTNFVLLTRQLATQSEAESGTDNIKLMTPLRTAQAIAATSIAIGDGQTWTDVSGSRTAGTDIQNTTGRPIMVAISQTGGTQRLVQVGATIGSYVQVGYVDGSGGIESTCTFVVPAGHYYTVGGSGGTIVIWAELR
jgi:hypothetical protein